MTSRMRASATKTGASDRTARRTAVGALLMCGLLLGACAGSSASGPPGATLGNAAPNSPAAAGTASPAPSAAGSAVPGPTDGTASASNGASQQPDVVGGTTSGDIPDNAVFLVYHSAGHGFSIQYVEGWQVTTQSDGVVVRDKDSSETVQIVPSQSDVGAYVTGTDLPALQAQSGFRLVKHDSVTIKGKAYEHVAYHLPAPPDPVTGKQVPSMVDRYYMPGTNGLAVVSLSTPDGVDNVDAFRQIIESFAWS